MDDNVILKYPPGILSNRCKNEINTFFEVLEVRCSLNFSKNTLNTRHIKVNIIKSITYNEFTMIFLESSAMTFDHILVYSPSKNINIFVLNCFSSARAIILFSRVLLEQSTLRVVRTIVKL